MSSDASFAKVIGLIAGTKRKLLVYVYDDFSPRTNIKISSSERNGGWHTVSFIDAERLIRYLTEVKRSFLLKETVVRTNYHEPDNKKQKQPCLIENHTTYEFTIHDSEHIHK